MSTRRKDWRSSAVVDSTAMRAQPAFAGLALMFALQGCSADAGTGVASNAEEPIAAGAEDRVVAKAQELGTPAIPEPGAVVWPNSGGSLRIDASPQGVLKGQIVLPTTNTSGTLAGDQKAMLTSANVSFGPYTVTLRNTGVSPIHSGSVSHSVTITVLGATPGLSASNTPLAFRTLGSATKTLTAALGQTTVSSIVVPVTLPSAFMDIKVVATFSPGPSHPEYPTNITYPATTCGSLTPGFTSTLDTCMQAAVNPTGILVPSVMPLSLVYEPSGNCSWSNFVFNSAIGTSMSLTQASSTATNVFWNYNALAGLVSDSSNVTQTFTQPQSATSAFSSTDVQGFGTAFGLPTWSPGNPLCNANINQGDTARTNGPGVGDQFVFAVQPTFLYWDTGGYKSFRLSKQSAPGTQETLGTAFVRQIDPNHPELRPSFMLSMDASQLATIRGLDPFAPSVPGAMTMPPPGDPVASSSGAALSPKRYIFLSRRCVSAGNPVQVTAGSAYDSATQSAITNGYQTITNSTDDVQKFTRTFVSAVAAAVGAYYGKNPFDTYGKVNDGYDNFFVHESTTTTVTQSFTTSYGTANSLSTGYAQSFLIKDQNREVDLDIYLDTFFGTLAFNPVTSCSAPRTGGFDMTWGSADAQWLADVNGDGFADYCRVQGSSLACSFGTRGGVMRGFVDFSSPIGDLGYGGRRWLADVNADGKADFCRAVGDGPGGTLVGCSYSTGLGFSSGFDSLTAVSDWGYDDRRWLVDVNGDRRADLCRAVGSSFGQGSYMGCNYARADGGFSTTFDVLTQVADWGWSDRRWLVDVNSDGQADFCRAVGDPANTQLACSLTTGNAVGAAPVYSTVADWGYADRRYMADVNGDGKADLCRAIGDSSGPGSFLDCLSMGPGAVLSGANQRAQVSDWGYPDRRWLAPVVDHGQFCRAVGNNAAPDSWMACQVF